MQFSVGGNSTKQSSAKALNIGEYRYLELTVSISKSTKFTIYPSDFGGGYEGESAYAVADTKTGATIATAGISTFTISEAGTYTLVLKLTKTATGSANAPKDISFRVDWK